MENNFLLTDDLLWDYADGFLASDEKIRVDEYLRQHPEQQERLEAILAEKRAFHALPLDNPKAGFADRVMASWAEETHTAYVAAAKGKDWIIYLISSVLGLFICAAFVVAGMQVAPTELPVEVPTIPDINWTDVTGNVAVQYGAYLILAVLMLKLVERYFQQRHALEKLKS